MSSSSREPSGKKFKYRTPRGSSTSLKALLVTVAQLAICFSAATQSEAHVSEFPSAQTTRAYSIEGSSAVLLGVINPHGHYAVWRFQWGPTRSYGHIAYKYAPEEGWRDDRPHEVEEPIECLSPHTLYHFRVIAYSRGRKVIGNDKTFRTLGLRYGRAVEYKHCPGHVPTA